MEKAFCAYWRTISLFSEQLMPLKHQNSGAYLTMLVLKLQRPGGLQGEKSALFRCDAPHVGHLSINFFCGS